MGSLRNYRNAVINGIAADTRIQAANIAVAPHPGKWDYAELRRYAKRTPALLVTALGGEVSRTPMHHIDVSMAAVLMTEDKAGRPKDDQGLDYTDLVLQILAKVPQHWGLSNAIRTPHDIACRNIYSEKADKDGVALWCIVWKQAFDLEKEDNGDIVELAGWAANWLAPGMIGKDYDGTEASTGKGAEPYARDEQDTD